MRTENKHLKRLENIAAADESEWERLVGKNKELQDEFRTIRAHFGFPLPTIDAATAWICADRQRCAGLEQEVNALAKKYAIPERWFTALFYLAVLGWPLGLFFRMGFPTGEITFDHSILENRWIVDNTVDLQNPIVQDFMQHPPELNGDICPQPQPSKDNSRKLDWRPVWEWSKRHPSVTRNRIAKMLSRNPVAVRRKLEELDAEVIGGK